MERRCPNCSRPGLTGGAPCLVVPPGPGSALSEYAANTKDNWRAKDCAIYMVTALTVKASDGVRRPLTHRTASCTLAFPASALHHCLVSDLSGCQPALIIHAVQHMDLATGAAACGYPAGAMQPSNYCCCYCC